MSVSSSYAQSMPYGAELEDPQKHLRALLDEAREDKPSWYAQRTHEWVMDMGIRDAAIARCALVLAHRLLRAYPSVTEGSPTFVQIEGALEWLFRG